MPIKVTRLGFGAALLLMGSPLLRGAQTLPTLDSYISGIVTESDALYSATIGEWSARHPGEAAQSPTDEDSNYHPAVFDPSPRVQQERKLEGRWCLRSTTVIELAGGMHVRRIALFYQPLVEDVYGKPLPNLPTEAGDPLRKSGCRLVRILHEFDGALDSVAVVDAITKHMPGKRVDEPGHLIEFSRDNYWSPICSFEKFGQPLSFHHLFVHAPKDSGTDNQSAVLLESRWGTLNYGEPSTKDINPLAGQPWLPLRAATLAGLPAGPTLDMLSFLAPSIGDPWEQPPLHCATKLIPVLRAWLNLAKQGDSQRHASAILLAHLVLDRLDSCQEFSDSNSYVSPEQQDALDKDYASLEKDLQELGITTEMPARLGNEHYSGNLIDEVLKLAPNGQVNELARIAILDARCVWHGTGESPDCRNTIKEGESFQASFPQDEWTPSVHLILAEAYALTASDSEEDASADSQARSEFEHKAALQYRAWYAKSTNDRDRPLVWQEIWALEAGMGPWLMIQGRQ
jgi:hypothetical protein